MPTYVTPGVYYEFVDNAPPAIGAVRLDITAFLGLAERGRVQEPVRVNSWQQFQSEFGNLVPQAYLGYAIKGFFENGGDQCRCCVIRIAAPERSTTTDPAAVQPADRASSIALSIDGFAPGAVVTVGQGGLRVDHLLRDVDAGGRKLTWEEPLEAGFVLASPIDFATGAAPADGVLFDGAGGLALGVAASSEGTWGNEVEVHVSHASLAGTVTAAVPQPAARASSLVVSVTGFLVGTVVKVFQDKSPSPLKEYRTVIAVESARKLLTWDSALPATFDLTKPISLESVEFDLTIFKQRRIVETYAGLSLESAHPRYAPMAVNAASGYIRLTDKNSASAWPDRLPAIASVRLGSGRDGTAAITMKDYAGDPASEQRRGIRLLEIVDEIGLLAIPDLMARPQPARRFDPPPPPKVNLCPCGVPHPPAPPPPPKLVESVPGFSLDQIAWIQQQMAAHCEAQRYRFALLDPPPFGGAARNEVSEIQSWRNRFDTKFAALYFPWVVVYDPLQPVQQMVRAIPPCGHMAGVIARTDLTIGVHKAPANVELAWAQDVTTAVDSNIQGILNPLNINCIRPLPGRGLRIYGARTLSSDTSWQFINVRRLLMLIEKSVEISTQWSVFEPNDYYLRQSLVLSISGFLESLWKKGALSGGSAADSFFVKADEENNPPALADLGQLMVEVGVAATYPAEFVIFRIGRTKDTLEITE